MFDNNSNNPLDFLIKRAISYGDQNNNILTAERFLLALIEVIDGTVETGNSGAYANATALLKNVCMDLGKLKKTLSVYINTDEASTVKERYHMQKVLQEAKKQHRCRRVLPQGPCLGRGTGRRDRDGAGTE